MHFDKADLVVGDDPGDTKVCHKPYKMHAQLRWHCLALFGQLVRCTADRHCQVYCVELEGQAAAIIHMHCCSDICVCSHLPTGVHTGECGLWQSPAVS